MTIRDSEGQFMTPTLYEQTQGRHHSLHSLRHPYLHLQEHLFLIRAAPEETVGLGKIQDHWQTPEGVVLCVGLVVVDGDLL